MERSAFVALPEGFVTNTKEIYQEVASYPVVPLEQVWQYWNVYTTTFRKMIDPTAYRLENFWWHVMGSDRRYLSGKALAKIFEEISTGPSFVPLKGPGHLRVKPPIPKPEQEELSKENGSGASPRPTPDHGEGHQHHLGKTPSDRNTMKEVTSSSSRPPPPHPILKKTRGPSTSGKRPTARFISPHESEDEAVKDAETSSSGSGDGKRLQMRRTAAHKAEKRSTPTGKRHVHVVSGSASRRARPGLARRQSSQSSGASDGGTKPSAGSKSPAGSIVGSLEPASTISHVGSANSNHGKSPVLSSKAAGKRPMKGQSVNEKPPVITHSAPVETIERPVTRQTQAPNTVMSAPARPRMSPTPSYESSRLRYEVSQESPTRPQAGSLTFKQQHHHPGSAMMIRSQSNIETLQHRTRGSVSGTPHIPRASFLSPSEATPSQTKVSTVAAEVQFDSESVKAVGAGSEARDIPDSVMLPSRASSASLFSPTQASTSPGIHLGRSKSQLTLLLERDKDSHGGKPRSFK